ncbi:type I-E CRISPR-associated protein Cas7/Cse4/CasC [Streptomyces sp. WAC01526]|uniref:type I-E CRISPR-associated protein Cas7/Cse4/CasC n=1 Tax=Streptomyces sp. WAC01526 TaxID=2588709 RepID=UPI001652A84F|nr:type I-E CRISPR-associated protein Cas7/Cse4/CasC [Streptomyces sp. WAC01526]
MTTASAARTPLYIDVHLIHSTPYANLNRDRQGAPKTATYGGSLRPRLSSQNGRRHTRTHLQNALGVRAFRTRRTPQEVSTRLIAQGWDADTALTVSQLLIIGADIKGLGLTTEGTNALLFLPETAFDALASIATEYREALTSAADSAAQAIADAKAKADAAAQKAAGSDGDQDDDPEEQEAAEAGPVAAAWKKISAADRKKITGEVLEVLRSRNASIAAFGRMLANESDSTFDGAVQMAHSLATHSARTQVDFFSAVDDVVHNAGTETGAGHMGDQRYTSATFYRYSTLNIRELVDNLDGDTDTALQVTSEFLRAFPLAVLPAKASGTAPHTVPHLIHVAARTDRPINLVGAYETPVPATTDGYLPASLAALDEHAGAHTRMLGNSRIAGAAHTALVDTEFEHLGERTDSLDHLVDHITSIIAKHIA